MSTSASLNLNTKAWVSKAMCDAGLLRGPGPRRWVALAPITAFVFLAGCAPSLPRPLSRVTLAETDTARALVHYLSQPGASAEVCGPDPAGLHVTPAVLGGKGGRQLCQAALKGQVEAPLWSDCMGRLVARLNDDEGRRLSAALLEAIAKGAQREPRAQGAGYRAVLRLFAERPERWSTDPKRRHRASRALKRALPRLGEEAHGQASEALAALAAESGRFRGRPVTTPVIELLHRQKDRPSLELLSRRLPSPDLRREATRRLIRLRLHASEHRELRAMEAEVEEAVLREGFFAVPLHRFPVLRAKLDERALGAAGFELGQDVVNQVVTLHRGGGTLPARLPLRGLLWITLEGITRPVTLCPRSPSLDPTPCVSPRAIEAQHPRAVMGPDGALALGRWPAAEAAEAFARPGSQLKIPLRLGGRVVATLGRLVRWRAPEALLFHGPAPGGQGPALLVEVVKAGRVRYTVQGAGRTFLLVIEPEDLGRFILGSRGAPGAPGWDGSAGMSGSDGTDGSSASCPSSGGSSGTNGSSGGPGGNGGPGGPGGSGGDIAVRLRCDRNACGALERALLASIHSVGGPGGPGGRGGPGGSGGRGGRGGSGTSCTNSEDNTTYLSGGSNGYSGLHGTRGLDGPAGEPGSAGAVRIVLEHEP